ncbi:MAG: DUF4079 domain-containing protein, partial [Cyanobacteria bacterium P01_H01_bin.121]
MNLELPENAKYWLNFGHPIMMWVLLGLTIYALYSGVQWRRTRTAKGDVKKQLVQGQFRDKHYKMGSLVLLLMVMGTLGGMAVTYIKNCKLFVCPH